MEPMCLAYDDFQYDDLQEVSEKTHFARRYATDHIHCSAMLS